MKYNLPERVVKDISKFAKKYSIEKDGVVTYEKV